MSAIDGRAGHTLGEALVALVVAGVLVICLAGILAGVGRVARRQAEASAAAETERTVAAILSGEVRMLAPGDATFDGDSMRLRAFRGRGVVCAASPGRIDVRWAGARMPEEDKDSVLLVWADGESAFGLTGSRGAACDGPALALSVDWSAAHARGAPLFALVFETGAYSISSAALRYRRGAAGRQPLTDETLSSTSGLDVVTRDGATSLLVTLRSLESRRAPLVAWPLGMLQGGGP